VGNLKPWKGQRTAVEALSLLLDRYPDLTLLLAGSVADEGYGTQLRALVKEKGLERQVIFCGFRKDVAELMNAADVILHTSIDPEPGGTVVLEAMALARPVIGSSIGGPAEMIEDGATGLLSPPGDAPALARAIEALLADPRRAQAMAGAGHRRLENLFSLRGHIAQVEALYEACLS
jgi:glycosyltransferase involved in cell wall biosynthesis